MEQNWFYQQRMKMNNDQAEQAKACGNISVSSISQYERGIAMPRMTDPVFPSIAKGYRVSEERLEQIILEISRELRKGTKKRPKAKGTRLNLAKSRRVPR